MFRPRVRIKGRLWDRITHDFPWHVPVIQKFREFVTRRSSKWLIEQLDIPRLGRAGRAFQPTSDVRIEMIVKRSRVTGAALITIAAVHVLSDGAWIEVLPL